MAEATMAIDPVCGMQVDPATAASSSEYKDQTYYFCSIGCKKQFDRNPEQFVDQAQEEHKGHDHSQHTHHDH
jgi:P-type Cu+ transporter